MFQQQQNETTDAVSGIDEIVRACDCHSNETVTLKKRDTKYNHMRKWMAEFISKSESRGNKIDRVNSIRMTKSTYFLYFLCAVPLDDVIKRTRPGKEVNDLKNSLCLSFCIYVEYSLYISSVLNLGRPNLLGW